MPNWTIINSDVIAGLRTIYDESVQCVVTSPPYWGLRDYGEPGQLGLESSPDCLGWATGQPCGECYICHLVAVFSEVKRVLKADGTLWLNLGDSYTSGGRATRDPAWVSQSSGLRNPSAGLDRANTPRGLKPKDLIMIPVRAALALQADGWYLRSDIIWHKANGMPESVTDRPTKAHEHIFLLTKSERYFYDQDGERTALLESSKARAAYGWYGTKEPDQRISIPDVTQKMGDRYAPPSGANLRDVWQFPTGAFSGAHFAVFPPELPEQCIKLGSSEGATVLDPFSGSGTTLLMANKLGRHSIGIELNPEYVKLAEARIAEGAGLSPEKAKELDLPAQLSYL